MGGICKQACVNEACEEMNKSMFDASAALVTLAPMSSANMGRDQKKELCRKKEELIFFYSELFFSFLGKSDTPHTLLAFGTGSDVLTELRSTATAKEEGVRKNPIIMSLDVTDFLRHPLNPIQVHPVQQPSSSSLFHPRGSVACRRQKTVDTIPHAPFLFRLSGSFDL